MTSGGTGHISVFLKMPGALSVLHSRGGGRTRFPCGLYRLEVVSSKVPLVEVLTLSTSKRGSV